MNNMSNPYKTREGGATVTVFVPYDCNNHCPFCINKKEYADCSGFSLDAILRSIHTMDEITPRCDFVFTGGEPLADLGSLQKMLDAIPNTHRIFINTTFPVQQKYSADEMIAFTKRNRDKITCINISRHMVHYVEECNDELLGSLKVPVRINCVLFKNYPHDGMIAFANRFAKYGLPIQFRADYTITTPENLYEREGDQILADLMKNFEYLGLDGCRIRCGYHFNNHGQHIAYHRTLPYSTMTETIDGTTYDILYDVLVKQTGEPHSDWTGVPLDVEAYRHVKFEPYDFKVLEGRVE